jgi:tetratricopeptide (TPR) repeat protein
MQCPQCQSPIEADAAGGKPNACPICGAAITAPPNPRARSRVSLITILFSLLLMALATISVGSTVVALRTAKERTAAKEHFSQAFDTVDRTTAALLVNDKLKGSLEPVRKELLQPSLDYYQKFVQASGKDESCLRELTSAEFHIAALQAKLGSKESVAALTRGMNFLKDLSKTPADPQTFPSLQACALKMVPPPEWLALKGASQMEIQAYGLSLFAAMGGAITTFDDLAKKNPKVIGFRDDLAALLRSSAMFNAFVGRRKQALGGLLQTRDVLETLVRDQGANVDFKNRLVETLVSAAKMQKSDGERDAAIGNYQRAVELRQQLATAAPDDPSLQKDLDAVKRDLDKLKNAPAKDAAQDAAAATPPAEAQ